MNIIEVTKPVFEPVSLTEIYTHLRLDPSGSPLEHPDDANLRIIRAAARRDAERITGLYFVERIVKQIERSFYSGLELIGTPYQGSAIVTYYDSDNVLQTYDDSNYFVVSDTVLPIMTATATAQGFTTYCRKDAVQILYVVGYPVIGSPGSEEEYQASIPDEVRQAVLIKIQLLYDDMTPDKRASLERLYNSLLMSVRTNFI